MDVSPNVDGIIIIRAAEQVGGQIIGARDGEVRLEIGYGNAARL